LRLRIAPPKTQPGSRRRLGVMRTKFVAGLLAAAKRKQDAAKPSHGRAKHLRHASPGKHDQLEPTSYDVVETLTRELRKFVSRFVR